MATPTKQQALIELYENGVITKEVVMQKFTDQYVNGEMNENQMASFLRLAGNNNLNIESLSAQKTFTQRTTMREDMMKELAQEVGPLESFLIGTGKGFHTIGAGVGLAEPLGEAEKEGMEALSEERPYTSGAGEIVGEAAPFVPLAPLAGAGLATSTGGRMIIPAAKHLATKALSAGVIGGLEGGIIQSGMEGDVSKGVGVGASIAVGAELLFPMLGRLGRKVIQRVRGKVPKGAVLDAAGKPTAELQEALDLAGMSFDDLTDDAVEVINKSPKLKPEQVARKEFLESKGLAPTQAQITREASDFQMQQEVRKTSTKVRKRLEQQESALISGFDEEIAKTGGTAVQSGSPVTDSVLSKSLKVDKKIGLLYGEARKRTAGAPDVKLEGLAGTVEKMMPSDRLMKGVPRAIKGQMVAEGIIDEEFKILRNATVDEAERIRKVANSVYSSTSPYGKRGLREIKDQIDFDVTKAAGEDIYNAARKSKADFEKALSGTKASKFSRRSKEVLRDILEDKIDPDQFFDKTVLSKSVRATDLEDIKRFITTGVDKEVGKEAMDDLKAEALQWIKDKSFIGPIDDAGNQAMSRSAFENALKKIGSPKMKVLFEKEEIQFLKDMGLVSKLREPVSGTMLGRGPTAQAVSRMEKLMKKIPIFGGLFEFIDFDAQGRALIKAKPEKIMIPRVGSGSLQSAAPAVGIAGTMEAPNE